MVQKFEFVVGEKQLLEKKDGDGRTSISMTKAATTTRANKWEHEM